MADNLNPTHMVTVVHFMETAKPRSPWPRHADTSGSISTGSAQATDGHLSKSRLVRNQRPGAVTTPEYRRSRATHVGSYEKLAGDQRINL